MSAFVRPPVGPVVLRLDEQETSILEQLASQLVDMLEDATRAGLATAVELDPAMARLVPEGYRDGSYVRGWGMIFDRLVAHVDAGSS